MSKIGPAVVAAIAIALTATCPAEEREAAKKIDSISVDLLNTIEVVGRLGIPLGEATEIVATVVSGDSLRTKAGQGTYFLRVLSVDNKKLNSEPILGFRLAPGCVAELPNDNFELFEMKTGKKTGTLTEAQITEIQKGYVGKKVVLLVYELGEFSGAPRKWPKDIGLWQDRDFHFRTYLRVLREQPVK